MPSVLSVTRYDAAGHVVLVECHHSMLPMIRTALLYVVELTVRSGVVSLFVVRSGVVSLFVVKINSF